MRQNLLNALFLSLVFASALSAASYEAIVSAVRGTVLELDAQQQVVRTLSVNAEVPEGHTVSTNAGATVTLVLANGGVVTLKPETSLVLEQMQLDGPPSMASYRPLRPSPANTRTRLRLDRGEVLGEVKGIRANSKFEVTSAVGTAGITGTKFVVNVTIVDGRYTMTVTNLDGSVVTTIEGASPVSLPAGSQATLSATYDTETGEVSEITTDGAPVSPSQVDSLSQEISNNVDAIEAEDSNVELPTDLIPVPDDFEQESTAADVIGSPI